MSQADISFEDRLFAAVVDRFFAPEWVSMMMMFNQQTGQSEPMMTQMPSPAARVAADIFNAKQSQILEAVKDKVDLDALADKLWERIQAGVIERLTSTGWMSSYDKDRDKLRQMINERVADELARRTLAQMDEASSLP